MSDQDRRALLMLGAGVRIARHRMGLSQRQLAGRTGVSQTAISRMECGKVWGMAIVMFARVAWALEERTPLGGCPHHHLCSLGARWRQLMAEHVAMPKLDFRDLEGWDPTMGADDPTMGADDPTMGADDPTMGADDPTMGADDPTEDLATGAHHRI